MLKCRKPAPALLMSLLLCGCGNPGSPLPPSLMLPQPVVDLSGERTGDAVRLHWTMTRRTTDGVVLRDDQRAVVCRVTSTGACEQAGELLVEAGRPAQFTDRLPPALREGAPRLLGYEVRLKNHAGRDAGASNVVYTAAGWAPPPVRSVVAQATAQGIVVRWQAPAVGAPASGARLLVRLERDRVLGEPASQTRDVGHGRPAEAGVPQPLEQTLEAVEHVPVAMREPTSQTREGGRLTSSGAWLPDHTVDAQAELNRSYRYTVQMVERETLGGHAVEVSGTAGRTGVVVAKDVFPPAVPTGVAAVADAEGGTIDLSWTANADPDLAGYVVYRRVEGASAAPERVSGKALLATPDWSDAGARKGVRYAYSISAVDASGNESARSAEVVEGLPG